MSEAFTIQQFIDAFKLGRTSVYEEIATGRLPTYKVGRRRFISANAARQWQQRLETAAQETGSEAAA
jgi:hypothetical protein